MTTATIDKAAKLEFLSRELQKTRAQKIEVERAVASLRGAVERAKVSHQTAIDTQDFATSDRARVARRADATEKALAECRSKIHAVDAAIGTDEAASTAKADELSGRAAAHRAAGQVEADAALAKAAALAEPLEAKAQLITRQVTERSEERLRLQIVTAEHNQAIGDARSVDQKWAGTPSVEVAKSELDRCTAALADQVALLEDLETRDQTIARQRSELNDNASSKPPAVFDGLVPRRG